MSFAMFLTLYLIGVAIIFAAWVFKLYLTREFIMEPDGTVYMIRYFIWKPKDPTNTKSRIYLHHFIRSDHDRALHDHPWNFESLILWGGYYEIADRRQIPAFEMIPSGGIAKWQPLLYNDGQRRENHYMRWFPPLSRISRKAGWRHKVILPEGKKAWTIVKVCGKVREWGFWIDDEKFCKHTNYELSTGICNED